jgi:hypothetical protein
VNYLADAGREDNGASPKMVRVTCRRAMPGSPEWCALCVRTDAKGPMQRWDDLR